MATVGIRFGLRIGDQYLSITSQNTGLVGATTSILKNPVRATMNAFTKGYQLTRYCGLFTQNSKVGVRLLPTAHE
jgi:hypothetical protein